MRAVDVDLKLVDEVVRNYFSEEYDKIIEEKKNASLIYHLSRYRWHAFEWLPLEGHATVLEVGSECGLKVILIDRGHQAEDVLAVTKNPILHSFGEAIEFIKSR